MPDALKSEGDSGAGSNLPNAPPKEDYYELEARMPQLVSTYGPFVLDVAEAMAACNLLKIKEIKHPFYPTMKAYYNLDSNAQLSILDDAVHIIEMLHNAGFKFYHMSPDEMVHAQEGKINFMFSIQEVEGLAELEHKWWVSKKRKEGWKYGERNAAKKASPYLMDDWTKIPEEIKEYNRQVIINLPKIFATGYYGIRRNR